jgi:nicotinate-nucleotide adenylyltransferase
MNSSNQTQSLEAPIGIFGGAFDPIHFGHLRSAFELLHRLPLAKIHFLPYRIPVHKANTLASTTHRLAMLRLAIQNEPAFCYDETEISRNSPSYMLDTLVSLHQQWPTTPLCVILGADAFNHLPTWHQWEKLITYCHFIVIERPNLRLKFEQNADLQKFLQQHRVDDSLFLMQNTFGSILTHRVSQLDISSTMIRQMLQQGQSPRYLLPEAVLDYIHQNQLYQNN